MAYRQAIDFMRIRQYVIDLIATGEAQPQQIPSSRKLAEKFGVTHTTIQRVIRELVAEGYLIPCKNGGALTCPRQADHTNMKIIGIVIGNGKNVFENYYHHRVCCELFLYLTHQSATICTQNLYLNSPWELPNSAEHNHLAGLIAIGITTDALNEQIRQLKNNGLPAVAFINPLETVSSYYFRYFDICKQVLRQLFREGRRKIIVVADAAVGGLENIAESVDEFLQEYGEDDHQVMVVTDPMEECLKKIKILLNFGSTLDAVVAFRQFPEIYNLVKKHLDIEQQCRMVTVEYSMHEDMKYSGYLITYDLNSVIKPMVNNLLNQIKGNAPEIADIVISASLHLYSHGDYINEVDISSTDR